MPDTPPFSQQANSLQNRTDDEWLFGWDPTPGIVSIWAGRDGRALVWRREGDRILRFTESFHPWFLTTSLDDLDYMRSKIAPTHSSESSRATIRYQEFRGPKNTYRYLISANQERILEQAVLTGATRRLGHRVSGFNDPSMRDRYYRVGSVEQYLMRTGKVYFRGLTYEQLHRLQFDLETTALDPNRGRIFMVSVHDNHGLATVLEAPTAEDEDHLIKELCALVRQHDPDIIENHNLFGFDLPFLERRAALLQIPLALGRSGGPMLLERREETLAVGPDASKRARYSVPGREMIDTLDAVRRHDFVMRELPSYRLKEVARYFGLASDERVYLAGDAIYETYQQDPEIVRHYALDDVREVDGLSLRLLGAPFALAGMAPRRYERLASAGPAMGILEPILVRAYLRSGEALPCKRSDRSSEDDLHEGGMVQLFAEGVAEHVVKADVASLYPSLMRTFSIGPQCDRLGVLLNVLSRLTDLRLQKKAAARSATKHASEARHHDATQAAMKIMINAAYGYMGAGSMALFADSRAAGEVTRRGREILQQVLAALQQQGMALIEADTDGVYFAVPPDWDEDQEQALVSRIAADLPHGIQLEYEGRYRAMLSHEVKNYALLTYDDQLIVHGVALRSSRAEPFGIHFLREAIRLTMLGDVLSLHQHYLQTAEKLRNREFPVSDLGSQVRLSKTPEAYMAARQNHPEPQYEALLTAGRTHWYPGERVRFYRGPNKRYVWLPEESGDHSVDHRDWEGLLPAPKPETPAALIASTFEDVYERKDYDVDYYLQLLLNSYAARLRKAFEPEDFSQLFRLEGQIGLFDEPIENIHPRWIRNTTISLE